MLFVCYPKCSTCQKARKWLEEKSIACTVRDIKSENPTGEELRAWHKASGLQYKALGLKDKLPAMTEDEQFALLATDGMLVKRPILVTENTVLVGFKEAEWEKIL